MPRTASEPGSLLPVQGWVHLTQPSDKGRGEIIVSKRHVSTVLGGVEVLRTSLALTSTLESAASSCMFSILDKRC